MNTKVWLLALSGLAAAVIVGCQEGPSFNKQHPHAVLLTQGVYPPPVVQAGACQNVYVLDNNSGTVVLHTATTQPTAIDLKDAAAFGGTRMLWNVNLNHHYSIYSESTLPQAIAPMPTPVTIAPAKPAVTTLPAPVIVAPEPKSPVKPAATTLPAALKPATKPVDTQAEAATVYRRGVDEWDVDRLDAARVDFAQAKALGYHTGFGERSPDDFISRIDRRIDQEVADAKAEADKKAQAAKPAAPVTPAPVAPLTKPVDPQIAAGEVYDRGVEEWNAQHWVAARADFLQAKKLGYQVGFGQRSPEEFVRRIDKKIAEANAAQAPSGAGKPATQPSTRPAK